MRKLPWTVAESHRYLPFDGSKFGDGWGAFMIPRCNNVTLRCIVSDGNYKEAGLSRDYAWEHVSVSVKTRIPTWEEMCFVKRLFWEPEELVVQFHPPESKYVNYHPNVLHLWRPLNFDIPLPPKDTI